jgi:hypothetical protein
VALHACQWRRALRVFAIAAAVAAAPLPALAGESPSPPSGAPSITESAARLVAAGRLVAQDRAARSRMAAGAAAAQTDLGSPGFFRSPAGIITLVAIGAGVGYALYSTSNDRVKSPAR